MFRTFSFILVGLPTLATRNAAYDRWRVLPAVAGSWLLALGSIAHANNSLRAGAMASTHGSSSGTPSSQTTTSATSATSTAVQTGVIAEQAQASLQHSIQALQALQAAQQQARNVAISGVNNLGLDPGHPGQTLPDVTDGLSANGLVPGMAATDPTTPTTTSISTTANGTTSVAIPYQSGITIPAGTSGSDKITASGSGVVGSITTGNVITPLTGGVATTVAPGSTISITQTGGSTVTFASGSTGLPSSATSPVPVSWSGIGGLTQSTFAPGTGQSTGQTTVTVTQTQQQALLTWQSFNVGKNTTLDFDQSEGGANVGQWVAINQITDPSLRPSQILGSIDAPGQVYVINQNGIIFGGSSQVDIGALTASSLALNPAYIANGLLNDAGNNYQFQFSSLYATTTARTGPRGHQVLTTTVAPLWTAPPATPSGGSVSVGAVPTGDVTVQAGAQLTSPANAESQGGRIALIAPNVVNDGTISTPDGQTILAAGLQVGFSAHNANDASLRGLDVYVGQVSVGASSLPTTGSFTFNGLPNNDELTFSGSGPVGTYTPPNSTTPLTLNGGTTVAIPTGSSVTLTSGAPSFAAVTTGQAGNVTNNGDIESSEADVTMEGYAVNQFGIINGSTSVTLNGRIDLLADYDAAAGLASGVDSFYPFMTGTVELGSQSVTQILPELSSTETTIGTTLPVSSLVNIQGLSIEMDPGALLLAPSAKQPSSTSSAALDLVGAELTSGMTLNAGSWSISGTQIGLRTTNFSNSSGTISLGAGSVIDVSGSENVSASVADNIIAVQLRGPQLADSPLQQNGALRGQTVYVDIRDTGVYDGTPWIGTPIGDISGYVNDVQRTVGELTVDGGSVALKAGGSVAIGTGSSINVSGGWINYAGADVQTTQVVSNGQILNISQATPNLVYLGIYTGYSSTSAKWGLTQISTNPLLSSPYYDAGYVQGGNGGTVSIAAPAVTLSGNLYGNTVEGAYQRTPQAELNATYADADFLPTTLTISGVPEASTFDLSFLEPKVAGISNVYLATSPNVEFESDAFISQNTPAANQIYLSQDIIDSDGFGNVAINTEASGDITVPAGISLTTLPGGQISFTAANIDIEGSVSAPGGYTANGVTTGGLSFEVVDIPPTDVIQFSTPAPDASRGQFTLGPKASLSSSGLVVDDRTSAAAPASEPFAIGGGKISITGLDVDLEPGSTMDVSGGVAVSSKGAETYGSAGTISILAGQDPLTPSLVSSGQLFLGATLTGYSGLAGGGGTLTIQSPLVQIGGSALLNGDSSTTPFTAGETSVTSNGTTLWLDQGNPIASSEFFNQGGFGTFTIEGLGQIETSGGAYVFDAAGDPVISPAVLIAPNTVITPIVENSIATSRSTTITLAPESHAEAASLLASQRTPVSLVFDAEGVTSGLPQDGPPEANGDAYLNGSGGGGIIVRGDLVMEAGSNIQTDPQTNPARGVSLLAANGTVAVLGSIDSPGGTITVTGGSTAGVSANQLLFYESLADQPFPTVDLGPHSILSTAGATELTVNSFGLPTGAVLPGGNIVISGNIVAEQGALLNVSGATAVLDESPTTLGTSANQGLAQPLIPTSIDSNAGAITFKGSQLLYSDATLVGAAGGPDAQGGSLFVSTAYADTANANAPLPDPQDVNLIISQTGLNGGFSLPANGPTGLAVLDGQPLATTASDIGVSVNSAVQGEPVYSYFAVDTNLFASSSMDSAAMNNGGVAGGFASLSLAGTLDFVGSVDITTARSLALATSSNSPKGQSGGVIYADSPVVLTSPYIALNSFQTSSEPDQVSAYPTATGGTGSLTVNASVLADVGNLSLQNIDTLSFNASSENAGDIRGNGTLQVANQINLNAGQIYPPTEAAFTIQANDISITTPTGQALPLLPLSAGGTLTLVANTIEQGGVLRAPFGIINLGTSSTQSITLSPGSITSVSGVDPTTGLGLTVPYGIVNQSGTWYDPDGNNISLTGPVAKNVTINAQNINIQSGSVIDLAGGGNLLAYQFTAGTGGNVDILASTGSQFSSTSFAIVPDYSADYAPDGTYSLNNNLVTNNAPDIGYYNSSLTVGEQIYLNASTGLPAGTYTLLPARYALLPGAFLVSAAGTGAPGASISQPDGSSLVSGYVTSGLNPVSSPLYGAFEVSSQVTVLADAPYTINLANSYFPTSAASNNVSTPRLPVDSGQLLLDATQTMAIQGTLLSQAPTGGLGGEVDIASPEDIYIVGPGEAASAPAGSLVLDSSQLTSFGAASLLIGGYRTTTVSGTSVTVTTGNIVVDNGGATTTLEGTTVDGLAAPDIILVSDDTLTVDPDAAIEQLGQLSGQAQALTLQGNGALLRLSSDTSAQITRQNVIAGDTTSVLSIGQGATLENANGGAAGALILDSTALVRIDPSTVDAPVLSAKALTFDSSLISLEVGAPKTAPDSGLVITPSQLGSLLASTQSLSFLSYSSIALYGSGQIGEVSTSATGQKIYQEASLSLHADDIYYADTQDSTGITINAQTVSLDNLSGNTSLPSLAGLGTGNLAINAQTITLGSNAMQLDQFANVAFNADGAILIKGLGTQAAGSDVMPTPASLSSSGNLTLTTPLITGASAADQAASATTTVSLDETISAGGSLLIQAPSTDLAPSLNSESLGASLTLMGSSITQASGNIVLHSGTLDLQATGARGSAGGGDIVVNGTLDVSGVSPTFYNLNKFTNGGHISIASLNGDVAMGSTGHINVSAAAGLGNADSGAGNGGTLSITSAGTFTASQIEGEGSTVTESVGTLQGVGGSFSLDVGSLDVSGAGQGLLSSFETDLTGFSRQTIRDRHDSTVTVDDSIKASSFNLSADQGSILVTGTIDASNVVTTDSAGNEILIGGSINLESGGSITLETGALLDASGSQLSNAGQGGTVTLEAGTYEGTALSTLASINLAGQIDLSINGGSGGTLYLQAPQIAGSAYVSGSTYTPIALNAAGGGTPVDVAISPIASGVVKNASNIIVVGNYVQDAQAQGSALIDNFEAPAEQNASSFMLSAATIQSRLFGASTANINVQPGEEIDNSEGSLELQNSWDLSSLRYGVPLFDSQGNTIANAAGNTILSEPGVLTMRAAANINIDFGASLNDGFDGSSGVAYTNVLMPIGSQSWSYNLTSGADFSAANIGAVQTSAQLQASGLGGSVQIGYQNTQFPIVLSENNVNNISQFYQTIRTGTGNITINSGGDVLLLNNLATIYTAGTQVDPTLGGTFAPPSGTSGEGATLPATYSTAGGNVAISAQGNIEHEAYSGTGSTLLADSSAELPTSWLDREGSVSADVPTTWWVDFTNFFEGVGALGGGNVTLSAGESVVNVDAVVPTNARLVNGNLNQLGGGNLTVQAGDNIDGGVYYVENGQGTLIAGNNIQTNSTRAALILGETPTALDDLPTTLFLGSADFSVEAGGNLLLGPAANPFLLPQSYNNIVSSDNLTSEISYFSTYASTDAINASALAGSVTIQDSADGGHQGSINNWYKNVLDAPVENASLGTEISAAEPWLLLTEATQGSDVTTDFGASSITTIGSPTNVYGGVTSLLPPTLRVTAYSGDIDLIGSLALSPSASGTVDLVAQGSINAFQIDESVTTGVVTYDWGSGLINLSDANPASIPSPSSPFTSASQLTALNLVFDTTGATEGLTLQTQQQLHANIGDESLHAQDPNPDPVYIYANTGNISGLNVFSATQAQVIAGQDITDIGLYIQNNNASDISLVDAGRDIIAYDASSLLRNEGGPNLLGESASEPIGIGTGAPNSGDIQISGPGTLEVLAGGNLTLGNDSGQNPNNHVVGDGLYTGLTSVGSQLNPALPFNGANIIAAAGLGAGLSAPAGLQASAMNFPAFISEFLNPTSAYSTTYLSDLASEMGMTNVSNSQVWSAFENLPVDRQDAYALDMFYLVLRDAGRDHNNPATPGFGNYSAGDEAIATLFPSDNTYSGDINVTSREIKTTSGGDIDLVAPGGQLTVGVLLPPGGQAVDQGILTVDGGNISIFADSNVLLGSSRIFTLHGGNEVIWSSTGNIDAGSSSKTVVSAPPTRVIVNPSSGYVETDLAGLSTGGGIGVLQSVVGAPPGNIDLIAPIGTVDAGDAGIRASGTLNIAAAHVANASNISAGGGTTGVPSSGPSVNLGALTAASAAAGSSQAAVQNNSPGHQNVAESTQDVPSIITVEVLGYGGGDQD